MNFLAIQNAIISDRFKEAQRADVKNWTNFRLAWIWDSEEWTFKQGRTTATVTAGSQTVGGLPADLNIVTRLRRSDGTPLTYMPPNDFDDAFYGQSATGTVSAYTFDAGSLLVGPTPSANETYELRYQKSATALSADGDTPAIPTLHHMALVHGGAAEGLKLQNDPTWEAFEQDFQASINVMRQSYLVNHRGESRQWGAYRVAF